MSGDVESELASFHRFVADALQHGRGDVSPEEAIDLWRSQCPAESDFEETVSAVQEALQDMENGDRGVAFEQFDRDFRQRHKL
jgi:hypothetical protein